MMRNTRMNVMRSESMLSSIVIIRLMGFCVSLSFYESFAFFLNNLGFTS